MINKLTKEQEKKILYYFNKWKKIGLEYKSIDREYAKKLLLEYVSIIDIKPKIFIFLESPMVCQLAMNLLDSQLRSQLDSQLCSQLDSQLYSQLDSQLCSQLYSQLYSQLDSQLHIQLLSQLHSQLGNQLLSQLHSQLYSQLDSQLHRQLDSQLGSQLYSQLYSQLDSQLYSQLDSQLGSQLDSQLHRQLGSQLHRQLDSQLGSQLYSQLDSQLHRQLDSIELDFYSGYYWTQCGNIMSGYCALYDYIDSELIKLKKGRKIWNLYKNICSELHYFYIFNDFVFCSEKPIELHYNSKDQLHNEFGSSVRYNDGYSLYNLNGVIVSKEIVVTSADKLDPKLVITETNAEVRKEIVKKIGIQNVITKLGYKTLEIGKDYVGNRCELILLDLQDGRQRPYLNMINPSTGEFHIEGVHPRCDTLEKAWNFRKPKKLQNIKIDDINGDDWYQQGDVVIWNNNATSIKSRPKILT